MPRTPMENLHLPLPESVYACLQAEARRAGRPSTVLVREAVDLWLADLRRRRLDEAIQSYADGAAGTTDDLDPELEAAEVDHAIALHGRQHPRR